jgi:hypothetical protein
VEKKRWMPSTGLFNKERSLVFRSRMEFHFVTMTLQERRVTERGETKRERETERGNQSVP